MRILLISNGNGEVAIAQRIAVAIRVFEPEALLEHLALVGTPSSTDELSVVGPTAAMPSGGLIAMFNLRNIFADLASGLIGLTLRQRQFLRAARGRYDLVISIGDVYALLMAGILRTRTIFVGTAKSVLVARYGAGELRLMRRAAYCFVRDEATAQDCRARGLPNVEAANAIVDLHDVDRIVDIVLPTAMQLVMLFPGSRASAYNEASLLCEVFAEARARNVVMLGALAVAPRLDRMKFVETLAKNGWHYDERGEYGAPWIVRGDACILLWTEQVGGLLAYTSL
ncbi:MAG TPA: hypothetical protein VMV73_05575, partial [Candidatus Dormibacteraeota bacterium]|nr:hypothetical protein [Candidatus Dormibacteraeota bacterium]